jgi:DNA-binding MarR family transcriptional regulator
MTARPTTDPADVAVARLARSLRDLIVAGDQLRRVSAAHDGIGLSEFMTLSQLFFDGPAGPSELARDLGLTPGSMTLLLDRLADLDYVDRLPHPSDRRRQVVSITATGEQLHRVAFSRFTGAVTDAVSGHRGAQADGLAAFVDAIVVAVRQRTEDFSSL